VCVCAPVTVELAANRSITVRQRAANERKFAAELRVNLCTPTLIHHSAQDPCF
jgi:hypothetical protein